MVDKHSNITAATTRTTAEQEQHQNTNKTKINVTMEHNLWYPNFPVSNIMTTTRTKQGQNTRTMLQQNIISGG